VYSEEVRRTALDLLETGRSLSSVSLELGISRFAIREWRDRGVEPKHQRRTACFMCGIAGVAAPSAYAALLGYYLGDGCISRAARTFVLRVSCDQRLPGIIDDVTGLMELGGHRAGRVQAPGCIVVQSYWNHWPCLFPQHGPGRKDLRTLAMTIWQREIVEMYPADFLRGLFHSDGSRFTNWTRRPVAGVMKRYEYPRWQFTNNSVEIRTWCCEALDLVGVPWRQSNWKTISVSTRTGVARLDDLIGPKC